MHHRKLKHKQPIYLSSGSRDSFLNMAGVVSEGAEDVSSLSLFTSFIESRGVIGLSCWGSMLFMVVICLRNFLVYVSS